MRTLDEPLARLQEEIEAIRRELALPKRPHEAVTDGRIDPISPA
jgi:hypothetical protein